MKIPIYGQEDIFLDESTELLYVNPNFSETAPLHTHNFYEFFVVTSGSAFHLINNAVQTVKKGDLIFIRPSDTHCYDFYHSEDFTIVNVGFSKRIFQKLYDFFDTDHFFQSLLNAPFPTSIPLKEEELLQVKNYMNSIGSLMNQPDINHAINHARCCLAQIFADYFFTNLNFDTNQSPLPHWLNHTLIEMQKIDNLQVGFPRMLELSNCSKNHLCRVLKSKFNQTPTQYINDQRLNYSIYLLKQTQYEILEISDICGFHNISHFYHLFKSKFSCSPAKFRKNLTK